MSYSEQIMSADKYPRIFSRQIEAIVYRDLSVSRRSIICLGLRLRQIIDLLASDKSRYFVQPRPIIVNSVLPAVLEETQALGFLNDCKCLVMGLRARATLVVQCSEVDLKSTEVSRGEISSASACKQPMLPAKVYITVPLIKDNKSLVKVSGKQLRRSHFQTSYFTLTVLLFTQVHKSIPENLLLGVALRCFSIPFREGWGSKNFPSRFMLQKSG